jgi:DNA-binding Lrp family transcriptional regulator
MSEQAQGQEPVAYIDIKDVDKEALQKEYEAGILSLRELSRKFSLDPKKGHVQIKRLADREGWAQDLGAKIQAKAEAKLAKQALPVEKREAPRIADKLIIEANAEAIVQVRMRHRTDISKGMALTLKLMEELEHHTDNLELLEQLGQIMYAPDKNGKDRLNEIYHAVISLPERLKSNKALSETVKNYIALEREAYGIKEAEQKDLGTVNVTVKQYAKPAAA